VIYYIPVLLFGAKPLNLLFPGGMPLASEFLPVIGLAKLGAKALAVINVTTIYKYWEVA